MLLLIEPVWNRNYNSQLCGGLLVLSLLIEPVWNRNLFLLSQTYIARSLLIEPVWNRNLSLHRPKHRVSRAFNRTSMESKLMKDHTKDT